MSGATAPPGKLLRHPALLRLLHWVHTALTLTLAVTGLYLSRPFLPPRVLRVATVRLAHLTFCPALTATLVLHVAYALFSGSWRDLFPMKSDWRALGGQLKYEFHLADEAPLGGKYNVLQKLLYLSFLPALLVEALTGWALAAHHSLTGSLVVRLAGGLQGVRLIHFFGALYLLLTATGHLYRVLTEPGYLASMVTGWAPAVPPTGTRAEKATRPPRLR